MSNLPDDFPTTITKDTTRVLFTDEYGYSNWGGCDNPEGILVVGQEYDVAKIEVHSWHTRVYLVGFPHKYFNSINFEAVYDPR